MLRSKLLNVAELSVFEAPHNDVEMTFVRC